VFDADRLERGGRRFLVVSPDGCQWPFSLGFAAQEKGGLATIEGHDLWLLTSLRSEMAQRKTSVVTQEFAAVSEILLVRERLAGFNRHSLDASAVMG
jgi:hypothetical protein